MNSFKIRTMIVCTVNLRCDYSYQLDEGLQIVAVPSNELHSECVGRLVLSLYRHKVQSHEHVSLPLSLPHTHPTPSQSSPPSPSLPLLYLALPCPPPPSPPPLFPFPPFLLLSSPPTVPTCLPCLALQYWPEWRPSLLETGSLPPAQQRRGCLPCTSSPWMTALHCEKHINTQLTLYVG